MKKMMALFLILALCLSFSACGGESSSGEVFYPDTSAELSTETATELFVDIPTAPLHIHIWKEANYQEPKTCTECGETEGEKLPASVEELGIPIYEPEMGILYPYTTTCIRDTTKSTTGTVEIIEYRVYPSDETHEGMEGYEWITVTFEYSLSGENLLAYGASAMCMAADYYMVDEFGNAVPMDDEETRSCACLFYGVTYEDCLEVDDGFVMGDWVYYETDEGSAASVSGTQTWSFRVPYGYDGVVFGVYDSKYGDAPTLEECADENALFFRFRGSDISAD